jgi:hypothetical protein
VVYQAALIWQSLSRSVRDGMKAGTWRDMLGSRGGCFLGANMPAAESDFRCVDGILVASWFARGKLESFGQEEEKRARWVVMDRCG